MGQSKLPEGAEAGFHLTDTDPWGATFSIHLYGAGRRGWFLANRRSYGTDEDTGPQPLGKGRWRTFLNLIRQARFWDLPEILPDPEPDGNTVDDGGVLTLAGRDGERYHRIVRVFEQGRERGLDQVLAFGRRVSGWFPPPQAPVSAAEAGPTDHPTPLMPHPGDFP